MREMEMARFLFRVTEYGRIQDGEALWENFDLELFLRNPRNVMEICVLGLGEKFKLELYVLILWLMSITL